MVYVSGAVMSLGGANYLVPPDAPPSAAVRQENFFAIGRLVRDLQPASTSGAFTVYLWMPAGPRERKALNLLSQKCLRVC